MYFPDLSIDRNFLPFGRTIKWVGWLDAGQEYARGEVETSVLERLRAFFAPPSLKTLGYHDCPFCGGAKGCAESFVEGEGGAAYRAPSLIVHYVEAHGYRPPEEFLRAMATSQLPQEQGQKEKGRKGQQA